MIKAVIFDMDGCFIDSEPLHWKAWNAVAEEYGMSIGKEKYKSFVGAGPEGIAQYIIDNGDGVDKDVEELRDFKIELQKDMLSDAKTRPGAEELAKELSEDHVIGLASSSSAITVQRMLEATGTRNLFSFVVSGDDVEEVKPAPDIYLLAAKLAGVEPDECLAFEDSISGVKSAKKAGMNCIAIPNEYTEKFDFSEADKVIKSFGEISIESITG